MQNWKFSEKLQFSKIDSERKYNSLSPNANFDPFKLQQEFAKIEPSIEEERDEAVSLRGEGDVDDRARKVPIFVPVI